MVRCRKRRGGTPTGERAPPCPPRTRERERDQGARPHPPMRTEGLRVCRRFAFLIFVSRARSRWSRYHRRRPSDGIGPGVFRSSWSKTRARRAARTHLLGHCERQRSNPVLVRRRGDCFVAEPVIGPAASGRTRGSSQCRAPMRRERASLHPLAAAFSHPGAPSRVDVERSPGPDNSERWSGRWDSNPRPQPWQGCALPLSYTRIQRREGKAAAAAGRLLWPKAAGLQPPPLPAYRSSPACPPMPATPDDFSPIWTARHRAPTVTHPPLFTVEQAQRAARDNCRAGTPRTCSCATRRTRYSSWWRRRRRDRPQGPAPAARRERAVLLRLGRAAARTAGRRARAR